MRQLLSYCYHHIYMAIVRWVNIIAYNLSGVDKSNQILLKELKGKYKGKRCFVVCNGPSLRTEDLTKIHNAGDISIAMNMIGRICKDTPWRPTFLNNTDACNYLRKNKKDSQNTECTYRIMTPDRYLNSFSRKGKLMFIRLDGNRKYLDNPKFEIDITRPFPSIGTTTYECLEIAVYLGCSDIYIIGCDMSYKVNLNRDGSITYNDAGRDHFYASEKEAAASTKLRPNSTWQLEIAYEAAAKASLENGYNIKNATRGGKLEFFPRVDFDSLF